MTSYRHWIKGKLLWRLPHPSNQRKRRPRELPDFSLGTKGSLKAQRLSGHDVLPFSYASARSTAVAVLKGEIHHHDLKFEAQMWLDL
ncbi:hypothetical protein HAX54_012313, partial [Datura stramonium]|nr:hypothetical protein [Datura stramonium]